MKYKNWTITSKKLKTGWKSKAKRVTRFGTQTVTQTTPFSKTKKSSIEGIKDSIRYYYK